MEINDLERENSESLSKEGGVAHDVKAIAFFSPPPERRLEDVTEFN